MKPSEKGTSTPLNNLIGIGLEIGLVVLMMLIALLIAMAVTGGRF